MIVKQLTIHLLEFLSFKGGCRGSSESALVKMLHCWKSHALAQMVFYVFPKLSHKSAILLKQWTLLQSLNIGLQLIPGTISSEKDACVNAEDQNLVSQF